MINDKLEAGFIIFLLILFSVVSRGLDITPSFTMWWSDLAWTLAAGAASWRTFQVARACHGKMCKGWYLISAANSAWFIGILSWDYYELIAGKSTPYPGIPDLGFIAFALLMLAGLYKLRSDAHRHHLYKLLQIGKMGVVVTSLLITHMVFFDVPLRTLDSSVLYKVTALAYPVIYISALLFSVSLFWRKDNSVNDSVINYLLLGLTTHAIVVSFYAYSLLGKNYQTGNYIDILWLVAFASTYWAASVQLRKIKSPQKNSDKTTVSFINLNFDIILPVAGLVILGYSIYLSRYDLTPELLATIFPIFIVLTLFIGLREWASQQFESLLSKERNEAEQANTAKSEFLSRMSHELRTPLNAILGFAQILEMNAGESKNKLQQSNAKEIIDAGNHLLFLINEILDIAKIESGKFNVSIESVSLDEILNECIPLIQTQITSKGIVLIDNVSCHGYTVKADYQRLKQVLLNLLSNAAKYNIEQGNITLSCIPINNHRLRINVTNTGNGLTTEEIDKLFIPFERLENSTSVEGTGIGLVISKHLIELMDGLIEVETSLGESTTFWLELALSD